ncbi:TRAP transporter large permease [Bacillus piscicola]|uniref:TRAP transporter large permease n=1 Tax=Bacillus piscicola TaxID=1632684 RepID=UPI001F08D761|nr:TRAP transporter large permease [Bacillus piscicola]
MEVVIALLLLCFLLVIGVPVPFSFFGSALYLIFAGDYAPSFLLPYGHSQMTNIVLLAIPLFIIAGGIMEKGGIAKRLVDLVELFVGRVKGGLGSATILSSAVFGSITGSAAATLSSIGSIMFPRLEKAGYPLGYSAALVANSSVLGMLIPPSSIMILYAWLGNQSVLASFLATLVPGIILITLLNVINFFMMKKNPAVETSVKMDPAAFVRTFGKRTYAASFALTLPLLVLGGIYGGIMTPTEAAGLAAFYALPLGFFVYKGLTWKKLKSVLVESATTTGVVMVMLFSVMILSRLYIMEDLPSQILNFLFAISENQLVLLLMINVFLIIIGMLMDDISGVLLATPILLPVVVGLGVDPIHFAAIIAVNLGMGNVTPPTAPLVYLSGRISKAPINQMLSPTLIMIIFGWIPTLIVTTLIPELSLYLPSLLLGYQP